MTTKITCPKVNLNGTSKESLRDDRIAMLRALRAAEQAIMDGAPHARDYAQGPGPNTYPEALAQHGRRLHVLALLKADISAETIALDDGVHEVDGFDWASVVPKEDAT